MHIVYCELFTGKDHRRQIPYPTTKAPHTSLSSLPSRRESSISFQSGESQSVRRCSDPAGAIVPRRSSGIAVGPRAKFSPILEHKDEETTDIGQHEETSTVDQEKEIVQKKKVASADQDKETNNVVQDEKITSVDQEETTTTTTIDINVDEDEVLAS